VGNDCGGAFDALATPSITDGLGMPTGESGGWSASLTVWSLSCALPWFELLSPLLQEVTMPATTDRPPPATHAFGHPRRARPWPLVAGVALAALLLALPGPAALAHPPGITQRVSVSSQGAAGDNDSVLAAVSADGRLVAFWSFASNLVPGDTNGTTDVFVRDRQAATTERVSVSSNEEQANASSSGAALSADGRLVAFSSAATNLVPGDVDDAALDVYLRDRQAGTTEGISTTQPPSGLLLHSASPSLSADGRLVAFHSWESNLVPGDTNGRFDVFVFDRQTQTTERVSLSSTGVEGNNDSTGPSISADGRLVAFTSDADNLVAGDGNFDLDVFVHDRQTHTTVRASVTSDGTETGFELGSLNAALSADGQVVAFESEGALVAEDGGFPVDVFVHDEQP
jgi:Tol biopolymer transport system component